MKNFSFSDEPISFWDLKGNFQLKMNNQFFLVQLIDSNGKVIKHKSMTFIPSHCEPICVGARDPVVSYSLDKNDKFIVRITNLSSSKLIVKWEGFPPPSNEFFVSANQSRDVSELLYWPIWELANMKKEMLISGELFDVDPTKKAKCQTTILIESKTDSFSITKETDKKLLVDLIDSSGKIIDFSKF